MLTYADVSGTSAVKAAVSHALVEDMLTLVLDVGLEQLHKVPAVGIHGTVHYIYILYSIYTVQFTMPACLRQHTSAYVSIRQHTRLERVFNERPLLCIMLSIRMLTSADVY